MILTCPECATRYDVDSAKFPAAGRKVRCKKCGHAWFQAGEQIAGQKVLVPEPTVLAPEPPPAAAPSEFRREPSPVVEAIPEPPASVAATPAVPGDEPDVSVMRSYREKVAANDISPSEFSTSRKSIPQRGGFFRPAAVVLGWLAFIGVVLIIGWSAKSYRQQIATLWPKSASLFARMGMAVNTRGLDFVNVQHASQVEDGQSVLVITGKLVNVSTRQVKVPRLQVMLSDAEKHPVYGWSFATKTGFLDPGQMTSFRTRLSNPPSTARHVDIHFAEGS